MYDRSFFVFQALWQLLWVNPLTQHNTGKSVSNDLSKKKPIDLIQNRVGVVVSELLSQVCAAKKLIILDQLWYFYKSV